MTGSPLGDEIEIRARDRSWWREELLLLLEIAALVGLAVVQPVLDVFGKSPETFLTVRASSGQIVGFALLVALVPLVVIELVVAPIRLLGRRARLGAQLLVITALVGSLVAQALNSSFEWRRLLVVAVSGPAGMTVAALYLRFRPVRTWLHYLSVTLPIFVATFLFVSPVAGLVRPSLVDATGVETHGRVKSVMLLVLDELPLESLLDGSGHIDAELFPAFARLAADGTFYRNATTVSPMTQHAVPAIVTGRYPTDLQAPATATSYPENLFTMLGTTHAMNVHETVGSMCPPSLCAVPSGSDAPVGDLLREARDIWWGRVRVGARQEHQFDFDPFAVSDQQVEDQAEAFVDSIGPEKGVPVLDFLHVELPHQPWLLLPDGTRYDAPRKTWGSEFLGWSSEHTALAGRARHLLQLQFADHVLGQLLDRLEAARRYRDTVVVVTADHGVAFMEGEYNRALTEGNAHSIGWVPMLVKPSGSSQGRIDDRIVRTIDVLPTIADLVGVRVPWPIDGRSMLGEERHEIRHRVVGGNLTHLEPNEDGGYSFEGPKNFARVLAAPAPGAGTGPLRIWRYGRYGSLVGQRVDAIGHGAPSALQAEIDEPGILVPDRPMVPPLPLWTAGSVDADDPVDLALVADGVVVGWTETRPGGAMGILAAAPLVRDGVEHAELDEIRGQGPSTTLHPVRLG